MYFHGTKNWTLIFKRWHEVLLEHDEYFLFSHSEKGASYEAPKYFPFSSVLSVSAARIRAHASAWEVKDRIKANGSQLSPSSLSILRFYPWILDHKIRPNMSFCYIIPFILRLFISYFYRILTLSPNFLFLYIRMSTKNKMNHELELKYIADMYGPK